MPSSEQSAIDQTATEQVTTQQAAIKGVIEEYDDSLYDENFDVIRSLALLIEQKILDLSSLEVFRTVDQVLQFARKEGISVTLAQAGYIANIYTSRDMSSEGRPSSMIYNKQNLVRSRAGALLGANKIDFRRFNFLSRRLFSELPNFYISYDPEDPKSLITAIRASSVMAGISIPTEKLNIGVTIIDVLSNDNPWAKELGVGSKASRSENGLTEYRLEALSVRLYSAHRERNLRQFMDTNSIEDFGREEKANKFMDSINEQFEEIAKLVNTDAMQTEHVIVKCRQGLDRSPFFLLLLIAGLIYKKHAYHFNRRELLALARFIQLEVGPGCSMDNLPTLDNRLGIDRALDKLYAHIDQDRQQLAVAWPSIAEQAVRSIQHEIIDTDWKIFGWGGRTIVTTNINGNEIKKRVPENMAKILDKINAFVLSQKNERQDKSEADWQKLLEEIKAIAKTAAAKHKKSSFCFFRCNMRDVKVQAYYERISRLALQVPALKPANFPLPGEQVSQASATNYLN